MADRIEDDHQRGTCVAQPSIITVSLDDQIDVDVAAIPRKRGRLISGAIDVINASNHSVDARSHGLKIAHGWRGSEVGRRTPLAPCDPRKSTFGSEERNKKLVASTSLASVLGASPMSRAAQRSSEGDHLTASHMQRRQTLDTSCALQSDDRRPDVTSRSPDRVRDLLNAEFLR